MIVAIIQARLGSTRYPRKIFSILADKPLIWHVVDRLKYSKKIDKIVLATTINTIDDETEKWANEEEVPVFRGSENNVLERYYLAAKHFSADVVVRITADDPFKDPEIIDNVIDKLIIEKLDFAFNNKPATFPEGLDTEVFTFEALEKAYLNSVDNYEKEHVTQYFYKNSQQFKQANFFNNSNLSSLRWTIDTEEDYLMAKRIYDKLYLKGSIFLTLDILRLLEQSPEIAQININVPRSAMYK